MVYFCVVVIASSVLLVSFSAIIIREPCHNYQIFLLLFKINGVWCFKRSEAYMTIFLFLQLHIIISHYHFVINLSFFLISSCLDG